MKNKIFFLFAFLLIGIGTNNLHAQDSDGDGIANILDLDDDNDGILDVTEGVVDNGNILEWGYNGTGDTPSIFNYTVISAAQNVTKGSGLTAQIFGVETSYSVSGVGATTISQSISNNSYFQFEFTTTNFPNTIQYLYDRFSLWVRDASVYPTYKMRLYLSTDNFATSTDISGEVAYPIVSNDQRVVFPLPSPYSLAPNKSYTLRLYFYDVLGGASATFNHDDFRVLTTQYADTDGDGIPNHLDLDSDNDGCVDAIEGGANITNGQLVNSAGTVNVGFGSTASNQNLCAGTICVDANGVPTIIGASGQTVGRSLDASKNDCLDTDGDGVPNWQDLDDDNDGILDAEESPTCFYTVFEANQVAGVLSSLNGAGTDPMAGINIPLLYNDNINDGAVAAAYNFAASQTLTTGLPIFTIKYPTAIAIKSLTVNQAANGMASGGFAKLYGSNDGVNYTLLTVGNGISIASATVTLNNTAVTEYLYYQIRYIGTVAAGNATSIAAGTTAIHEISSLAASTPVYNPSAHPKPGICGVDTDGDTIPNHLDPDSDGDGCSDAYEGGSTSASSVTVIPGPYGANGLANSLETSSESGVINYISTYRKYAVKSTEKLCLDSDSDGVSNPIDLDDDNDGVLDTDESDFCGKLDRNIRIGYLNTAVGSTGLATNLLYNLNNFGTNGVYNKVRGVTLIPFATAASVTEANLLAQNIDIFYVGSSANDAVTATDKIPTSVNTILTTWAKNNKKGIFALQNNAIDYGYVVTANNTNPNTPIGVLGRDYYTNGYWPTPSLNQVGGVQMTIKSLTREFEFLMLDANLRPVVIADSEYNLVIFPDATIYINESGNPTPTTNDQKAIADTWSYVFDKYLDTQCTFLDTDGDLTPNHLDLDSDDDGCSDAIEAGATTSNVTNFAFVTNAGTATDSNSDGLADIVDANLNGIPDYLSTYNPEALDDTIKKCSDSDGDGIIDIVDLDDDNDGILDTNEGLSCNSLNRNLRIGYLNTTVGTNGLMLNMLNNPVNFSLTGTYNKFPGITFVPYATEASITEAQLLTDNIDVFYVGSSAADTQTTTDKLLTATNNRILSWATNNDKGVVVLQNNATDYGYLITNNNLNANIPYGPLGESVFANGYWPVNTFSQSGSVQMTINSASKNYETAMADAEGKATFIRDRDEKIVFIPDATIFISNQAASNIGTDATLKVAADVWAFAFDTFLDGVSCTSTDLDNDGIPDHLDLDSDNDGCVDAFEGDENVTNAQLTTASGTVTVGIGSTASNQNLGTIVNANGVPTVVNSGGAADIGGDVGQGIGSSTDATVNNCFCYKPAVLDAGNTYPSKHGITTLGRAGIENENWPMVRQSAWTVLESKEKGFVVNRVATTSGLANITNPVEGMIVYDEEADCLKIYTLKSDDTLMGWHCFITPTCPD